VGGLVLSAEKAISQTEILTFDDLPYPGTGYSYSGGLPVPEGYGGLQWDDFWYLDGVNTPSSGFQTGVVSPTNVGFNGYDGAPSVSGAVFNLNSAYLTGAWNDGLQVEVQGFVAGVLIYDNTYTVNATGPSFINFNYLGVDDVHFISSGGTQHVGFYGGIGEHFAIDNMSITIVSEPSAFTLFGLAGVLWVFRLPNKLLQATRDCGSSSASRFTSFGSACLSFCR